MLPSFFIILYKKSVFSNERVCSWRGQSFVNRDGWILLIVLKHLAIYFIMQIFITTILLGTSWWVEYLLRFIYNPLVWSSLFASRFLSLFQLGMIVLKNHSCALWNIHLTLILSIWYSIIISLLWILSISIGRQATSYLGKLDLVDMAVSDIFKSCFNIIDIGFISKSNTFISLGTIKFIKAFNLILIVRVWRKLILIRIS